ncbi:hypothetical protein RJ55_00064 [Drechmeria coniospora]|nr:hypothetical protein RJ55_00064 [Drechmeria coniospora]
MSPTSQVAQPPRDEFVSSHLFALLPPELRLKVWAFNLPRSRLVSIRCGSRSPSLHQLAEGPLACSTGCTSDATIPINLHVCAESRTDAFKSYRHAFGFARGPGHVIFNPDSDILFFGPRDGYMAADSQFHTCMSMCDQAELASVRRVAISDALFWVDDVYRSMTAASLTVEVIKQLALRMPRLEHVIFVPREDGEAADLAVAVKRMALQIETAAANVRRQFPNWRFPPWDIMCRSSLSAACS